MEKKYRRRVEGKGEGGWKGEERKKDSEKEIERENGRQAKRRLKERRPKGKKRKGKREVKRVGERKIKERRTMEGMKLKELWVWTEREKRKLNVCDVWDFSIEDFRNNFFVGYKFFSSNDFECLEGVQESMDELMN